MGVDSSETPGFGVPQLRPARVVLSPRVRVQRVRCVLSDGRRFLFVQNNARRQENHGKWSLTGGRLKAREQARAALRRELMEEIGLRVPYLVDVGDWWHGDEYHRVFGCETERADPSLHDDEILACAWLEYSDVKELAALCRLRWGF